MKNKEYYETALLQFRKSMLEANKAILELEEAIEKSCEEPTVLNVEYFIKSIKKDSSSFKSKPVWTEGDVRDAGNFCFKNGLLKQWLNHKELREAVNYLAEDWTCTNDCRIKIENALKNLKSLNENER